LVPRERGTTEDPRNPEPVTQPGDHAAPSALGPSFRADPHTEHVPTGKHAKAKANLAAIEVLDRADREARRATVGELQVLAGWSGWGALPEMFEEPPRPEWTALAARLRSALSDDDWRAARASTPNAHYTSTAVAAAVWESVVALGFERGRVLEPGCGSGNFLGLVPQDREVELVGVEKDPTTARIAALLYPDAAITAAPFEKAHFDDATFDLVLGNVPFANVTPHDPVHNRNGWSLHNYFIAKSTALVRPGGLIAVVTSRYTLDATDPAFRMRLAERMDLLGAVRLPGTAFKAVAGTNAITDILLMRRREHDLDHTTPLAARPDGWLHSVAFDGPGAGGHSADAPRVNEWFLARPAERVCGTLTVGPGQYRSNDLVVEPPPDLGGALRVALAGITSNQGPSAPLSTVLPVQPEPPPEPRPSPSAAGMVGLDDLPDGSLIADPDGGFARMEGPSRVPHRVPANQWYELRALLELRDVTRALLRTESTGGNDAEIAAARAELNRVYDAYVEQFGAVNRSTSTVTKRIDAATGEPVRSRRFPPMGGFRLDPGWALVAALERYDDETGIATRANVFTERVLKPREPVDHVDSPADAVAVSLDETGRVDLAVVARLLDVDEPTAREHITDLVFDDPYADSLIPADDYLSGNVRTKLADAERAAAADEGGRFRRNVDALRAVLPADLGPAEIDVALGAPWVAPADVAAFIREVFGARDVGITHDPLVTAWEVGVPTYQRKTVEMTSTWGTTRRSATDLVEAALNQRLVTVFDPLPDGGRVVNEVDTMAARDKLEQITERFRTWVWEDPERADRLTTIYNERFNSIVLRRFDGSHLQLPGLASWFRPHAHQRDAVWRILNQGDVLLAHVVGAGKTATMVMAAMEMRRLGLVTKPCFVVPNHMLEQFTREFLQLYPQARVLSMNLGGTTPEARRRFVAQCATGDWDGVILPRESFRSIPVSTETEERFLRQRVDELESAIKSARTKRPSVKELEKALAREEARLEKLLNAKARDNGLAFEQTGIDYLFVDEVHGYKGKRVWSRIPDVTGIESRRATDLDMKLSWLREQHPKRVATLATGTPIANAISEMWVMQSFTQPAELAAAGCDHFDAWAATFASTVTSLELKPSGGGFQQKTRFARYRNVPELLRLFQANADVRTAEDLALPTPTVRDGGETVAVPASPALLAYVETLVARAERVKQRAVRPTEDNMLKITVDGRKAALDLHLVTAGSEATDGVSVFGRVGDIAVPGKIDTCAQRVAAIWTTNQGRVYTDSTGGPAQRTGALQIVFCDLGTPNGAHTWSVYEELRRQLAAHGVPAEQVRFVHEARNDREKAELFQACRDGRVSVIVGSSEKMGVGTNIQDRAIALHHLDCPWRPAELEQREGRILRQGNQNPEVEILRYVTEGSFDVFMWQTVTRKAKFINQVMSSDPASVAREVDDLGDQALTYSQVMAIATGNPLIMERATVEADLSKLRRLRSAHDAEQALLRRRVETWKNDLAQLTPMLERLRDAEAKRTPTNGDLFKVTMADGSTVTSRGQWGEWLRDTIVEHASKYNTRERTIEAGTLGGLDIQIVIPDQRMQHDAQITIAATGQRVTLSRTDAVGADPVGLARRVEHLIDRLHAAIEDTEAKIERTRDQLDAATGRIGLPFARQPELGGLQRRLGEIEEALAPAPTSGEDLLAVDPRPSQLSRVRAAARQAGGLSM